MTWTKFWCLLFLLNLSTAVLDLYTGHALMAAISAFFAGAWLMAGIMERAQ